MKIIAKDISKMYYRNHHDTNVFYALNKTDITLEEGQLIEIMGRSGSGKTTLSQLLCGLLEPSSGTVYIDEMNLYELDDEDRSIFRNKHIGMIPQIQTGINSLTVLENVLLPVLMYSDDDKTDKAYELLKLLDIDYLSDVYVNELSGGELRRMAIARAFMNDPDIIIADEPTGDLDDDMTHTVLKLLKDYAKKGHIVLVVTHDQDALAYADSVYKMDKGYIKRENV